MKKQIPPPSNWQDFEDLCKEVFGEIWSCKYTIKKNGRNGQKQCGVDVYGKPEGETQLYGVQCKGRDINLGRKLTKSEINEEIEKAMSFKPPLKVFVFATTAEKDAETEEYIREKSDESIASGNFEILLYDWEDIADRIRRNKNLYRYYVENQHLEDDNSISVSFNDEKKHLIVSPKLLKTTYRQDLDRHKNEMQNILNESRLVFKMPTLEHPINHSWLKINVHFYNDGNVTIDDWKLWLYFDEYIIKLNDDSGYVSVSGARIKSYLFSDTPRTVITYDEDNSILCLPYENEPLVPNNGKIFKFSILASPETEVSTIKWELLSRNYSTKGEVQLYFEPEYVTKIEHIKMNSENDSCERVEVSHYITEP